MRFFTSNDIQNMSDEMLVYLIENKALDFKTVKEILLRVDLSDKCLRVYLLCHGFDQTEVDRIIKRGTESIAKHLREVA